MMRVDSVDFAALLPRFMRVQEDDRAMADALSVLLSARGRRCMEMSVWEMVREMDETVLDAVAEAFGLAWWRPDWSPSVKREMLGKAEQIRLGIGTKATLEGVLQVYFSDPSLTVEEWFDYGGKPYTFRILTNEATVQRQLQFARVVDALKRTSQSMDGIFVGFSMRGTVHVGAKGSDSRTERGEAVAYAYLPKGTVLADGIYGGFEKIIMEASGVDENIADTYVEAVSDGDFTLESDAPLVISGEGAPLPATHDRRERLDAAVARWWSAIGVEQDGPSIAYAWPPPQPAPAADLLTGLDIHLSFGDSATFDGTDKSGHTGRDFRNNAGWSVPLSVITDGKIGSAVRGDGGGEVSSVETNLNSIFPCGSAKDWSISGWIRTTNTTIRDGAFLCWARTYRPSGSGFPFTRSPRVSGGRVELSESSVQSAVIADGQWHHVVATHSVAEAKCTLWVDGAEVGSEPDNGWNDVAYPSSDARIMVGTDGGYYGIVGDIDEVSVWGNRAIGHAEVDALYNGGAGLPFEAWT